MGVTLEISHLDFIVGYHKTLVTSRSDKLIYSPLDYVDVLGQSSGGPLYPTCNLALFKLNCFPFFHSATQSFLLEIFKFHEMILTELS